MKKRVLSFLLVLALLAACLSGALAAEIMLSVQNLKVNGIPIRCEKYNIDGANYFKLRDLAYLLSGTESRFALDYDAQRRLVTVTTGADYVPNGTELVFNGEDHSAEAVISSQTILIDGQEASDLSVYNIGGSNFFQLRQLSEVLGFEVEYDKSTNTALVRSRQPSQRRELTPEEIYAACAPAVFYIEIYDEDGVCTKTGSGFFLTSEGLAVTNYHVISGAASAAITVSDTKETREVLGVYDYSVEEDWAVLQIDGSGFQTLEIGDPGYDVGGATVYAIGSPLGLQNTISQGIISNPARPDGGVTYIQMSAAISHGSSGGALLNKYGQVIGITSATYSDGQNLNLAIPMTYLSGMSVDTCVPLGTAQKTPSGVLSLSSDRLDLKLEEEGIITAYAVESNCSGVSVRYSLSQEGVVSCAWGSWRGDYVDLTVTPEAIGSAEVTVYFLISDTETILDTKTFRVTVSASGTGVQDTGYPVEFEVSTRYLYTSLFDTPAIDIFARYPADDENTVVNRYISDPYVAECTWSEWDGDRISLNIHPLSSGSTDIRIVYSLQDGTVLAEETVHVTVFYGLITASAESVTLAPGEEATLLFTCTAEGGEYFTLRYVMSETGIVSGQWGEWYENGTDCPLTLTGLASGDMELEIRMIDSDTEFCMTALRIPVRVS